MHAAGDLSPWFTRVYRSAVQGHDHTRLEPPARQHGDGVVLQRRDEHNVRHESAALDRLKRIGFEHSYCLDELLGSAVHVLQHASLWAERDRFCLVLPM